MAIEHIDVTAYDTPFVIKRGTPAAARSEKKIKENGSEAISFRTNSDYRLLIAEKAW